LRRPQSRLPVCLVRYQVINRIVIKIRATINSPKISQSIYLLVGSWNVSLLAAHAVVAYAPFEGLNNMDDFREKVCSRVQQAADSTNLFDFDLANERGRQLWRPPVSAKVNAQGARISSICWC